MAVDEELPQLECGRTTEQVWAGINRPPDRHEQDCAYCSQARRRLGLLEQAIHSAHDLTPDTQQPSARVKTAIMDIARNEIRQGRRIPLEMGSAVPTDEPDAEDSDAELAITERALIEIVTRAGDRVDRARTRRVRVEAARPAAGQEQTTERQQPITLDIRITISLRAGAVVAETVDTLRNQIIDDIARQVGVTVRRIDVAVEDIHEQ